MLLGFSQSYQLNKSVVSCKVPQVRVFEQKQISSLLLFSWNYHNVKSPTIVYWISTCCHIIYKPVLSVQKLEVWIAWIWATLCQYYYYFDTHVLSVCIEKFTNLKTCFVYRGCMSTTEQILYHSGTLLPKILSVFWHTNKEYLQKKNIFKRM